MGYQIPHFGLARQYKNLQEELLEATHDVLSSGQLVNGKYTKAFEKWLCLKTGAKYAVTVHSGSQALYFIAKYWLKKYSGILHKPVILVPNLTYPATLNAFLEAGWTVEIGDTDKFGILDPKHDYTQDVIKCLVGLYGRQPDKPGSTWSNGAIIDGAQHWLIPNVFTGIGMAVSFDPTKNLPASGNGGAVLTDNSELYQYVTTAKDNGKVVDFNSTGTNSKMSEQDCAQILVRSKYIDQWQARRKEISNYFCSSFKNLPLSCLSDSDVSHAHQKFVVYTPDRNALRTNLLLDGIETKVHYEYALSELNISKNLNRPDMISTSIMLSRGVLSLPIYPELTDYEIEYIVERVQAFYR